MRERKKEEEMENGDSPTFVRENLQTAAFFMLHGLKNVQKCSWCNFAFRMVCKNSNFVQTFHIHVHCTYYTVQYVHSKILSNHPKVIWKGITFILLLFSWLFSSSILLSKLLMPTSVYPTKQTITTIFFRKTYASYLSLFQQFSAYLYST